MSPRAGRARLARQLACAPLVCCAFGCAGLLDCAPCVQGLHICLCPAVLRCCDLSAPASLCLAAPAAADKRRLPNRPKSPSWQAGSAGAHEPPHQCRCLSMSPPCCSLMLAAGGVEFCPGEPHGRLSSDGEGGGCVSCVPPSSAALLTRCSLALCPWLLALLLLGRRVPVVFLTWSPWRGVDQGPFAFMRYCWACRLAWTGQSLV